MAATSYRGGWDRIRRVGWAALPGLLAIALLGGCAADPEREAEMALACQLTTCICQSTGEPFFMAKETIEPLWRDNGDAYCPEGFALLLPE